MAVLMLLLFVFIPVLSKQLTQFFKELPNMVSQGQFLLMQLPERFPSLINEEQVSEMIAFIRGELLGFGQALFSTPLASVVGLITILVYLILMPLLVFFLLKDKDVILKWIEDFLPGDRELTNEVWFEVNQKIASYVTRKIPGNFYSAFCNLCNFHVFRFTLRNAVSSFSWVVSDNSLCWCGSHHFARYVCGLFSMGNFW